MRVLGSFAQAGAQACKLTPDALRQKRTSPDSPQREGDVHAARVFHLNSHFTLWECGCKGVTLHTRFLAASVAARPSTTATRQERQECTTSRFLAMIPTELRAAGSVQEAEELRLPSSKASRRARTPLAPPSVEQPPATTSKAEHQDTPPAPRVLATYASAEEVSAARPLSLGARRLWGLLHRLALDMSRDRGYTFVASQIVLHLPLASLAGNLGYHPDHVARLGRELERAGLLDRGGHVQRVKGFSMYDGTLWAVLMVPGGEPPRIRAEEWRHNWRPGYEAELDAKTGAAWEMSELHARGADAEEKYQAARARAANPGVDAQNHPPLPSSDNYDHTSLKTVVERLGEIWHLHPSKRPRAIGLLASQIARVLLEPERRLYWCKVIWDALKSQNELRGGLQVLAAQISRLEVDLREGAPWRNPGAVLAARLKTT